jgi:hypothetical protein
VRHVTLRDLDQVRDQVVAAGELDVDLREGVLVRIARGDQAVVDADRQPPTSTTTTTRRSRENRNDMVNSSAIR